MNYPMTRLFAPIAWGSLKKSYFPAHSLFVVSWQPQLLSKRVKASRAGEILVTICASGTLEDKVYGSFE